MATINLYLSARTGGDGCAEVLMRVSCGRGRQFRIHSGIRVPPERWDAVTGRLSKPRGDRAEAARLTALQVSLDEVTGRVAIAAETPRVDRAALDEAATGVAARQGDGTIADAIERFRMGRNVSENTDRNYVTLRNTVRRFIAVMARVRPRVTDLTADVDARWVERFRDFLAHEGQYAARYPEIYAEFRSPGQKRPVSDKSPSSVGAVMDILNTVMRWCVDQGEIAANPCARVKRTEVAYGTPFFLTVDERDRLADAGLEEESRTVRSARDVFVFQCLVGCRHSDLVRLRESSVVGDFIEYVPKKTRGHHGDTVRVPLHPRARAIIERYAGWREEQGEGRLLPAWDLTNYNKHIRTAVRAAGITRAVTVLDARTREEVQRPICDVASSHMARRTFCGNLYKKVRDPNLVGALSGHVEGSKAFARYRDIDDEMRRDLIEML